MRENGGIASKTIADRRPGLSASKSELIRFHREHAGFVFTAPLSEVHFSAIKDSDACLAE